ncbi:MAG: hypothetical protein QNJ31_09355 [Candidatus Caenarcaniphilales bacterium]|nr:hypothetical protein [Candidatus Caenarcaniphilales bacterium]
MTQRSILQNQPNSVFHSSRNSRAKKGLLKKFQEERLDRLVALITLGYNNKEIAEILGRKNASRHSKTLDPDVVSWHTKNVYNYLQYHGFEVTNRFQLIAFFTIFNREEVSKKVKEKFLEECIFILKTIKLTDEQKEVANLICQGHSNKEIASLLTNKGNQYSYAKVGCLRQQMMDVSLLPDPLSLFYGLNGFVTDIQFLNFEPEFKNFNPEVVLESYKNGFEKFWEQCKISPGSYIKTLWELLNLYKKH